MNTQDQPSLNKVTIDITTEDGAVSTPAINHDNCTGLAVTMVQFGFFVVTHAETGLKLSDKYERAGSALLVLSQFALIAKENGFSWDGGTQSEVTGIMKEIYQKPVPFDGATITSKNGTRKQTVIEWIHNLRAINIRGYVDEFPWEEHCPWNDALDNLESC